MRKTTRGFAGKCAFLFALAVGLLAATNANAVTSTFDADLDGWTSVHPTELSWNSSGGNPGGYARFVDGFSTGGMIFAPAKFLGDWSGLDETGSITFDQKVFRTGNYSSRGNRFVSISGPGGEADWLGDSAPASCQSNPACDWTGFVVPLNEASWTVSSGSWSALLTDVTAFGIQLELYTTTLPPADIEGLDNVQLVPEPSTALLFASGLIGLAVNGRRGRA
jgi:hypothetical protein